MYLDGIDGYHILSCTVTYLYDMLLNLQEIVEHQGQQRRKTEKIWCLRRLMKLLQLVC